MIDLRARQFQEDQGPLSHPVRPESFQEINNFYTATVYEKGAEVIGMLKRLVGDQAYQKAVALYFDRHDGQACTIEDWLKVFEDATGRDLTQFKRWYSQAGTPKVKVTEEYEGEVYRLTLKQSLEPSETTPDPQPQVIPFAIGLLGARWDGGAFDRGAGADRSTPDIRLRRIFRPSGALPAAWLLRAGDARFHARQRVSVGP